MTDFFYSFAYGLATVDHNNQYLEVFYPEPVLYPSRKIVEQLANVLEYQGGNHSIEISETELQAIYTITKPNQATSRFDLSLKPSSNKRIIVTFLETDSKITSAPEAYLKLHLLSHRLVKPNTLNLENIFSVLPNIAWTNKGPLPPEKVGIEQLKSRHQGDSLKVYSIDKFPPMSDYVIPSGVRIGDSSRVRLGAYLGEGTTVMHEGFINFNAGTEGPNMIEGRISQGVMVGKNSDIGGGASTMGTLSGGGKEIISIGENCLLGANSGIGISLGDNCTVEAGLYITAGSIVTIVDKEKNTTNRVKARSLSGLSDLLFIRHSSNGDIQCHPQKITNALNKLLHSFN